MGLDSDRQAVSTPIPKIPFVSFTVTMHDGGEANIKLLSHIITQIKEGHGGAVGFDPSGDLLLWWKVTDADRATHLNLMGIEEVWIALALDSTD